MWAESIWQEHPTLGRPRDLVQEAIAQAANAIRVSTSPGLPIPQEGAQTTFYNSEADITIYGGAAGAGKSAALLTRAAKWTNVSGYGAVLFRQTSPEITNEGGLWDESKKMYGGIEGVQFREGDLDWTFPSGSAISFRHGDRLEQKFLGAQAAYIGIDEVTDWTEEEFWFLLSRNRSVCGVAPKLDATCNPDPKSFIAKLIDWWIDPITGYPIEERSGVVRYFYRIEKVMHWADSPEELMQRFPEMAAIAPPKSFTFIRGTIYDNKILLKTNPQYLANLLSQDPVQQERLLKGNWKVDVTKQILFDADAIKVYKTAKWLDKPEYQHFYLACIDPNYGGKNFWVCQIWDLTKLPYKLVAEYRENYRKPLHCRKKSMELIDKFGAFFLAVEADNGGVVIAEQIQSERPKLHVEITRASAIAKIVNSDRIARALEDGDIRYPPDWIGIAEMENFSAAKRCAIVESEQINDDTITCWAAGFAHLETALSLRVRRNHVVEGTMGGGRDRLSW